MKNLRPLFLLFLLTACANDLVSQAEVSQKNAICFQQFAAGAQMKDQKRWSKWARCKKQHTMPLEMKDYNLAESEIAPVYETLIADYAAFEKTIGSIPKENEQKKLDEIYDAYEQSKADLGLRTCILWNDLGGGNKKCEIWK